MELTMRISEFEWREVDHNQFSGRTSSIHARGRVWSNKATRTRTICSSGTNLGWFYSDVPDELNDLIEETNKLVIVDLMDRNVIPKQWPAALLASRPTPEDNHPFHFKLISTVLVDPNWRMDGDDSPEVSYVNMNIWSPHHGSIKSKCDLDLPEDHIRKAFDLLDEVI